MKKELRVLLIEDIALDAEIIDHELRKSKIPFRSTRVETEDQFRQEVDQQHPDVILSDHGMPSFDGFTALALARQRCPEVPFIFVTGAHGDEVAAETIKRGADDYVLKSHLHHLVPAIRRALTQAEERARHERTEAALRQAREQLRRLTEETQATIERSVRQRTHQLAADHRELQEFTYTIASNLRTPLRHLDRFSGMLQKLAGDKLDHKSRDCLHHITEASRQLGKFTDELLTFTRISQVEMYTMRFSLADVVKEIRQELHRETEGREIEWVLGELPEVEGDPTLLGLALTNLIANAIKFTRPRPHARIEIGSRVTDQEIILHVGDNGIGFDTRRMDKLFGIFQRLHTHPEIEGLGTGLANVRRIIHRHGGRTWAEGNPGQGATFYVSLPRTQAPLPSSFEEVPEGDG